MSGRWSQEKACKQLGVCDGRTLSDLAGDRISTATGGIISPPAGKEVFHLGLFLTGVLLVASLLEGHANQR